MQFIAFDPASCQSEPLISKLVPNPMLPITVVISDSLRMRLEKTSNQKWPFRSKVHAQFHITTARLQMATVLTCCHSIIVKRTSTTMSTSHEISIITFSFDTFRMSNAMYNIERALLKSSPCHIHPIVKSNMPWCHIPPGGGGSCQAAGRVGNKAT